MENVIVKFPFSFLLIFSDANDNVHRINNDLSGSSESYKDSIQATSRQSDTRQITFDEQSK